MTDLFDFRPPSKKFAVIGNPISHSKSPLIHQQFATQCGIDLEYDRTQVDVGGFEQAVSHFAAHGGAGLNITAPFKVEAWQLCCGKGHTLAEAAELAESVNTLKFEDDGVIHGANTDGIGMVRDIQTNLGVPIVGKHVLMIGAGGAVRGVLQPVLSASPAEVVVVNRTAGKAIELAQRFNEEGYGNIRAVAMSEINDAFDIIINGTAASLQGNLPDVPRAAVTSKTMVYDMTYSNMPTLFMQWALSLGAGHASDGLGMLVEQAAESFFIWHGVRPDTAAVIEFLRKQ